MKALLLSALVLSLSSGVQARSILVFKKTHDCSPAVAGKSQASVEVSEAADGQARLVISVAGEKITAYGKKITPPKMMAGGTTRYVVSDSKTNTEAVLAFGAMPIKVGKIVGKKATLDIKGHSESVLVCAAVK